VGEPDHEVPLEFRDAVAELLYHSQMIEALLRVYLADINEAADILLHREGVRFKHRVDAFGKRPLGQLVDQFEAHSDNDDVVRRLRAFAQHRNAAAHTAYAWAFVNRGKPENVAVALEYVRSHCVEGRALVELVTLETIKTYQLKTDPRLLLPTASKPDAGAATAAPQDK